MNVNMNAVSFYGKQLWASREASKKGKPGQLHRPSGHQTHLLVRRRKAAVATEGLSSEPFVERTQCREEQPPGKIPTAIPGHMTCSVHMAHGKLSIGLPRGTNQEHVRWPRCSALFGLVSHTDSCPRAETLWQLCFNCCLIVCRPFFFLFFPKKTWSCLSFKSCDYWVERGRETTWSGPRRRWLRESGVLWSLPCLVWQVACNSCS